MRYSLRTLLIAVALFGLCCARVAYLKQTAAAHRRRASELVYEIGRNEGLGAAQAQDEVSMFEEGGFPIQISLSRSGDSYSTMFIDNKTRSGMSVSDDQVPTWRAAIFHEVMARRFESAVYRPWNLVPDADAPYRDLRPFFPPLESQPAQSWGADPFAVQDARPQ
jgi:hypothetical protein